MIKDVTCLAYLVVVLKRRRNTEKRRNPVLRSRRNLYAKNKPNSNKIQIKETLRTKVNTSNDNLKDGSIPDETNRT